MMLVQTLSTTIEFLDIKVMVFHHISLLGWLSNVSLFFLYLNDGINIYLISLNSPTYDHTLSIQH